MAAEPAGQRRRSTLVLAHLSDKEAVDMYDSHLEQVEADLDRLLSDMDPTSVRCKKLAIDFFTHLMQVRNALLRLAPGERRCLAAAFGSTEEGCERMARLLVSLNGGADADAEPEGGIMQLQQSGSEVQAVFGTADRLDISKSTLQAYQSVAAVLDAVSLRKAIKCAQDKRQRHKLVLGMATKLKARASMARRSVSAVAAQEQAIAATPGDHHPATADELLLSLDHSSSADCGEHLDQIFAQFDDNGDGVLAGKEYDLLIDKVTDYVVQEYLQKFSRYKMTCNRAMIKEWVKGTLDQDTDGQITRDELGMLKKIVDDID